MTCPKQQKYANFILYADDANIILTANTIEEINNQLKNLTNTLIKWVNLNGLALNINKKTKYMIFSRSCIIELPEPLIISDTLVEHKREARFIGVIMDESLNWSSHVKAIQSKSVMLCRYHV